MISQSSVNTIIGCIDRTCHLSMSIFGLIVWIYKPLLQSDFAIAITQSTTSTTNKNIEYYTRQYSTSSRARMYK